MYDLVKLICVTLAICATAMLIPAAYAAIGNDGIYAGLFITCALLIGFISVLLGISVRGKRAPFSEKHLFWVLALVWFITPVLCAIPFLWVGQGTSISSALFESTAAFTTTGGSIFNAQDLPEPIILWRAIVAWFGGLASLISFVIILGPAGIGGLPRVGRTIHDGGVRHLYDVFLSPIARSITAAYASVSVLGTLFLFISGRTLFDAFCLAGTTISTTGFYNLLPSKDIENLLSIFFVSLLMIYGMTNFITVKQSVNGDRRVLYKDREIPTHLLIIAGLTIIILLSLLEGPSSRTNQLPSLFIALFSAISIVSTTGLPQLPVSLSSGPILLLFACIFAGGATYSTAGGLKIYRIYTVLQQAHQDLIKLIYPHAVRSGQNNMFRKDFVALSGIWSLMSAFLVSGILVMAAIFLFSDFEFIPILAMVISMLANSGELYQTVAADLNNWPAYDELPDRALNVLFLTMIAGRLEIIILIGIVWNGISNR